MHVEARQHFVKRLSEEQTLKEPFEHFYVKDAFPQDYFATLLSNLPGTDAYTDNQYQNRMLARVGEAGQFWADLETEFSNSLFPILDCFPGTITRSRFKKWRFDVRLVRDAAGYQIKPHTDIKAKAVSLLFYLAGDERDGTQLLVPKETGFTSDGNRRYEHELFNVVAKVPFLPNSVLGFPRSNKSFHSVLPSNAAREVLLFNIYHAADGQWNDDPDRIARGQRY